MHVLQVHHPLGSELATQTPPLATSKGRYYPSIIALIGPIKVLRARYRTRPVDGAVCPR